MLITERIIYPKRNLFAHRACDILRGQETHIGNGDLEGLKRFMKKLK